MKLCRRGAAPGARGSGSPEEGRSGIDTEMPKPAEIEGTEPNDALPQSGGTSPLENKNLLGSPPKLMDPCRVDRARRLCAQHMYIYIYIYMSIYIYIYIYIYRGRGLRHAGGSSREHGITKILPWRGT